MEPGIENKHLGWKELIKENLIAPMTYLDKLRNRFGVGFVVALVFGLPLITFTVGVLLKSQSLTSAAFVITGLELFYFTAVPHKT